MHVYLRVYTYTYVYGIYFSHTYRQDIYIYTHTHTHTHIYIFIYIYIHICFRGQQGFASCKNCSSNSHIYTYAPTLLCFQGRDSDMEPGANNIHRFHAFVCLGLVKPTHIHRYERTYICAISHTYAHAYIYDVEEVV